MRRSQVPLRQAGQEARSLDVVQRAVISALVAVVFGTFAAVLAAYLVLAGDRDLPRSSVIGLWIMTGVMGLGTTAAILVINRRRPYIPWVLLGILPMAISAPRDSGLTTAFTYSRTRTRR